MGNGTVNQNTTMVIGLLAGLLQTPTPTPEGDSQPPNSCNTAAARDNTLEVDPNQINRPYQVIERMILYVLVVCLLVHIFYTKHKVMASPSQQICKCRDIALRLQSALGKGEDDFCFPIWVPDSI